SCASLHPRPGGCSGANRVAWVTDPQPSGPAGDAGDEAGVQEANRRYYEAFESRDLDLMSDVWEHSDRIACTHPGWRTLRGWGAVSASWFAIFGGPQQLQVILTNEA